MEGKWRMLYKRLGGYDAIAAVCDDLLPRLMGDAQLARFWQNRAEDSLRREKQDPGDRAITLIPWGFRRRYGPVIRAPGSLAQSRQLDACHSAFTDAETRNHLW